MDTAFCDPTKSDPHLAKIRFYSPSIRNWRRCIRRWYTKKVATWKTVDQTRPIRFELIELFFFAKARAKLLTMYHDIYAKYCDVGTFTPKKVANVLEFQVPGWFDQMTNALLTPFIDPDGIIFYPDPRTFRNQTQNRGPLINARPARAGGPPAVPLAVPVPHSLTASPARPAIAEHAWYSPDFNPEDFTSGGGILGYPDEASLRYGILYFPSIEEAIGYAFTGESLTSTSTEVPNVAPLRQRVIYYRHNQAQVQHGEAHIDEHHTIWLHPHIPPQVGHCPNGQYPGGGPAGQAAINGWDAYAPIIQAQFYPETSARALQNRHFAGPGQTGPNVPININEVQCSINIRQHQNQLQTVRIVEVEQFDDDYDEWFWAGSSISNNYPDNFFPVPKYGGPDSLGPEYDYLIAWPQCEQVDDGAQPNESMRSFLILTPVVRWLLITDNYMINRLGPYTSPSDNWGRSKVLQLDSYHVEPAEMRAQQRTHHLKYLRQKYLASGQIYADMYFSRLAVESSNLHFPSMTTSPSQPSKSEKSFPGKGHARHQDEEKSQEPHPKRTNNKRKGKKKNRVKESRHAPPEQDDDPEPPNSGYGRGRGRARGRGRGRGRR